MKCKFLSHEFLKNDFSLTTAQVKSKSFNCQKCKQKFYNFNFKCN